MGTEAHRETKRFAGMGRRTSVSADPTPNRPHRRPGTKDLTLVGSPPLAPDLSAIPYLLSFRRILFFSTPGPVL